MDYLWAPKHQPLVGDFNFGLNQQLMVTNIHSMAWWALNIKLRTNLVQKLKLLNSDLNFPFKLINFSCFIWWIILIYSYMNSQHCTTGDLCSFKPKRVTSRDFLEYRRNRSLWCATSYSSSLKYTIHVFSESMLRKVI